MEQVDYKVVVLSCEGMMLAGFDTTDQIEAINTSEKWAREDQNRSHGVFIDGPQGFVNPDGTVGSTGYSWKVGQPRIKTKHSLRPGPWTSTPY